MTSEKIIVFETKYFLIVGPLLAFEEGSIEHNLRGQIRRRQRFLAKLN